MKIGFILSSAIAKPLASTRIAVLNIIPYLEQAGHEVVILFTPEVATEFPTLDLDADRIVAQRFDVVCFQKVTGPSVTTLADRLRQHRVRTIALVCDYVYAELTAATDMTFIVTDYLRSLYPAELQPKVHVVHDGIENPALHKSTYRPDRGTSRRPLRAVLVVGNQLDEIPVLHMPPKWLKVTLVGPYPAEREWLRRCSRWSSRFRLQVGWRAKVRFLRFLITPRIACVPWDPGTVYDFLEQADIGILAFETPSQPDARIGAPRWKVKSENRLTMMMSAGLPVVATPIPAYEAIVVPGDNAFLVSDRAGWLEALERLRDPGLRRRMGGRARADVVTRFSREAQVKRWLDLLQRLDSPEHGTTGGVTTGD